MTGIRYRPSLVSVFASIALSLAAVPLTRLNQRHELASRDAEAAYWDHSGEIKAWAALGDSFSAGLGAGKRIDFVCSRYDQAYPNVVNENFYLGDKKDRDFKFLACSGVEADHVLKKQIPKLSDASLDMATLSIGGNDVGLKDLLNACVYQWWVGTKSGGYCEETLQNTQKTIDGPELSKSFDDILRELGKKMKKDAKIYWTSYSNFFCDDTRDCDKVTWSFKHNIGRRQYLTKERRETMNKLTQDLHGKIKDAIKRFGDQAVWVPWDDGVTAMHGRYCEAGVDENDAKAKDREQLVFFEWGTTVDDDPTLPPSDELRKRELPANPGDDETFEGEIGDLIQEAVKNGVDPVEFGLEKGSVPTEGGQEGGNGQQKESLTSWLLPDKYGRIFHPQKYGHLLIAEAVLRAMDTTKAQKLGQKAAVTTIVGVPMQTGAASHLGERNGCTADKKDKQSREFTVDEAKSRAEEFCLKAIETDVDVGNDGLLDQYPNGDDDGKTKFATSSIVYQVTLSTDPKCDKYPNKGKMNYYYCLDTFQDAVNGCDIHTQSQKLGGTKTSDCMIHNIKGVKGGDYTKGQCKAHIWHKLNDVNKKDSGGGDLTSTGTDEQGTYSQLKVQVYDSFTGEGEDKRDKVIGYSDFTDASKDKPLSVATRIGDTLDIRPDGDKDVAFNIGGQKWSSGDSREGGKTGCEVGRWNPRSDRPQTRELDCLFDCK